MRLLRPARRPPSRSGRTLGRGPRRLALLAAAAAAAAAFAAGCDNPACVFGPGNCVGVDGPGGALAPQAFAPSDGVWIVDGAPAVSDVEPTGTGISTTTPVAIFFSESLASSTVTSAFRIERDSGFGSPIPVPATSSLVGDGRVLVLLPQLALEESTTYRVFYSQSANARDYTGQSLTTTPGAELATFTTAATDPDAPRVVATYPRDDATAESATGEITVVFDRPMVAAGFVGNGFAVTADGVPPTFDPAPSPLMLGGAIGVPDTRVWRWRSADATGTPVPLGNGVDVAVSLSPAGAKLNASSGGELPATIFEFTTATFGAPLEGTLVSSPSDAIGIANLVPGGGDDLVLEVEVDGAQAGDRVDLFIFGVDHGEEPELKAIQRSITLSGPDFDTAVFDLADFDLTTSTSPLVARFADGELVIAMRLQRGALPSPITLLDVDPEAAGAQGPVLDTVPPELVDLLAPGGGGDLFRSDLAGLTLAGTASEPLRRVSVTTLLGDNGAAPDVVGSDDSGFFVARPVPLGVLDPADQPLEYEFVLFDRALNASTPVVGFYRQLGAASGGPLVSDDVLAVEVFDAVTLTPVEDALVVTHADLGDASAYPLLGDDATDEAGLAAVPTHAAGQAGTIVTVDAAGYDRFTFHGVEAARLSVPLTRTPAPTAAAGGVVTTSGVFAGLTLPTSDLALDDTRRSVLAPPTFNAQACTGGLFGQGLSCPFGPEPIAPARAGARSFFAGDFELLEPNFSAASLIKAFELGTALAPVEIGGVDSGGIDVAGLLNEPGVPAQELPVALPVALAEAFFANGVDLGALVDEAPFGARPRVAVEWLLPGQHHPLTAGLGLAYATGSPTSWNARAAYPGAVFALAEELGDPAQTLRLVAEWRDTLGALSRISLGFDDVAAFGNVLFGPPVPVALAPAPDEALAQPSFDVVVPNNLLDGVLPGSTDGAGMYRVRLVDASGRGWTLWRPDVADGESADVRLHVPDVTAAGGAALASGPLTLVTGSAAFGAFDPAGFLFSALELEAQFRTQSAPRTVQVP